MLSVFLPERLLSVWHKSSTMVSNLWRHESRWRTATIVRSSNVHRHWKTDYLRFRWQNFNSKVSLWNWFWKFTNESPFRNVSISSSEPEYSGLYSFNIDTKKWKHISIEGLSSNGDVSVVKSKANYCMVFNQKNRKLYIQGGQRGNIDEFLTYDVDTGAIQILNNTQSKDEQPPYSQSVRASIDCERDEIYLLSVSFSSNFL